MVTASLAQLKIPLLIRLGLSRLDDDVAERAICELLPPLPIYSTLTFTSTPTDHCLRLIISAAICPAWLLPSCSGHSVHVHHRIESEAQGREGFGG